MAKDWLCSQPGCGMHHSDHVKERQSKVRRETVSYLKFEEIWPSRVRKTKMFRVTNLEGQILGGISFSGAWRKYVFQGGDSTSMFDAGCLQDIVDFLKEQTQSWRDSL